MYENATLFTGNKEWHRYRYTRTSGRQAGERVPKMVLHCLIWSVQLSMA